MISLFSFCSNPDYFPAKPNQLVLLPATERDRLHLCVGGGKSTPGHNGGHNLLTNLEL